MSDTPEPTNGSATGEAGPVDPVTAATADLGQIVGEPQPVTLRCGIAVDVREVATLELFQILTILLKGFETNPQALASLDPDAEDFNKKLMMFLLAAVGKAGPETVAFLRMCVEPSGLVKGKLDKAQLTRNNAAIGALDEAMVNPPLVDTLALSKAIFDVNLPHLAELGKDLAGLVKMARQTGQIPQFLTFPD